MKTKEQLEVMRDRWIVESQRYGVYAYLDEVVYNKAYIYKAIGNKYREIVKIEVRY